jgi:serine/threonine-protein kinase PRP4
MGILGKGVFSTVLKAIDLETPLSEEEQLQQQQLHAKSNQHSSSYNNNNLASNSTATHLTHKVVALKMIRNNETMRKAAEKEKLILQQLQKHDPHNKRFCVRLITTLENYRQHVAFVFEYYEMNLRETLKKFGKDVGINIAAIRTYGRQLMISLKYLSELRIIHADIKLDNILISSDLKTIKLCDFGSAFYETDTDNDPTPYLVSRFYRAPEVILGLPCKSLFSLSCYLSTNQL